MLLKTAPMAGIYVGEICTGKKIEPGYVKGTADVSCFPETPDYAL